MEGSPLNAGQLVLSPTRTYAPVIKAIFGQLKDEVHGMVHCSGGGQTKVLHFIDQLHVVKNDLFPMPTLFRLLREQSGTSLREMYQVFNMGHRMELYVKQERAGEIIAIAGAFNMDARIVGHCEAAPQKKLTITTPEGSFVYH